MPIENMQNKSKISAGVYLKGIGMMVGMMFGAGIFALPFSFAQAGLFWGLVHFILALLLMLFLHFLYAEVTHFTKGKHRFTGYVGMFLGKRAKQFAFLTTLASYYGTLLIYGLLGGLFLSSFFGGNYKFGISIAFFILSAFLLFLNISKIAEINFYLTIPLFGFVIYLLFAAAPEIRAVNLFSGINFSFGGDWFLPYGIWIFALSAFAVLPEARDIFSKSSVVHFKRMIAISIVLSSFFYFLFILAVLGVSGANTSPDALSGLSKILGLKALLAGSFIGFLAVFTSFLAMGEDMENIFKYDYGIPKVVSWLLVVVPPAALFLLGAVDFATILSIIGAVGLGVFGIFIILMARKLREVIKKGDSAGLLRADISGRMTPRPFIEILALIGITVAASYELWRIFV